MANELTGPAPTTSTVVCPSNRRGDRAAPRCAPLFSAGDADRFDAVGDPTVLVEWWLCWHQRARATGR
jgi:hypothetical protein